MLQYVTIGLGLRQNIFFYPTFLVTKYLKTYRYWRLFNWPKEPGITPESLLFERSKVWSFGREPSWGGIPPEMLLFCNNLQIPATKMKHNNRKQSVPKKKRLKSKTRLVSLLYFLNKHFQTKRKECTNGLPKKWTKNQNLVSFPYTWRRLVRFPIDPDKVPERDWLGAPLQAKPRNATAFISSFYESSKL